MSTYQPSDEAITAANTRRHNGHGTDLQVRDAVNAELAAGRLHLPGGPAAGLEVVHSALAAAADLAQAAADQQARVDITVEGDGPYEVVYEEHPDADHGVWTEWIVKHAGTGLPEYSSLVEAEAVAVAAALNGLARGRAPTA